MDLQPYTQAKLKEEELSEHTWVTLGLDEGLGFTGWQRNAPASVSLSMEDSTVTHFSDSKV